MAQKLLVLNGPNLNMLGLREPHLYGHTTLPQLESVLVALAQSLGVTLSTFQSNHEGALVDRIQQARTNGTDFIIVNAGAYTHTSVAIRDALAGVSIAFVEVHVSNVYKREEFRHHSYLSDLAVGVVAGLGPAGYEAAVRFAAQYEPI
jgi:3-dehydroquinate dehydratase-2